MKQAQEYCCSPGRDASQSQGYPQIVCHRYPYIHLGEKRQSGVKFLVPKKRRGQGLNPGPLDRSLRKHPFLLALRRWGRFARRRARRNGCFRRPSRSEYEVLTARPQTPPHKKKKYQWQVCPRDYLIPVHLDKFQFSQRFLLCLDDFY